MMEDLCINCEKEPIHIKKRRLCKNCYQKQQRQLGGYKVKDCVAIEHPSEVKFIKSFFSHFNWLYRPAIFRTEEFRYEPTFYDNTNNTFIQVIGTRQGYEANKGKYRKFVHIFPHIKFEVRRASGEIIDIGARRQDWKP